MFSQQHGSFLHSEEDQGSVFLNVTPLIDILTCLLFFLLLSFGAVIIALINVTVPALGDVTDQNEADKVVKITVTISITEKGFVVSASSDKLSENELKKLQKSFALTPAGYDYQGMTDHLTELKKRFKESDSVVIVPEPDIPYEVLIKTLDASREREEVVGKRTVWHPLFPAAVVSTLVK
jgi:biopolymer transport protein ExbD